MVLLKEIKLFDTNIYDKKIIKSLYRRILNKDDYWHFFFEGVFIVIRCQDRFVKNVSEILKKKNIKFSVSDYEEDQKITKKYLKQFIPIFHNYSVLAMIYKNEDDFLTLLHRIVHCFLNPASSIDLIKKYNYENSPGTWESHLLADLATTHAYSRGKIIGKIEEQHKENKQ